MRLNRIMVQILCWSMIFSENRYPLFRIMLYAGGVHSSALAPASASTRAWSAASSRAGPEYTT
jgi:hypothetical protein